MTFENIYNRACLFSRNPATNVSAEIFDTLGTKGVVFQEEDCSEDIVFRTVGWLYLDDILFMLISPSPYFINFNSWFSETHSLLLLLRPPMS
jgi:hypothetical protein